MTDEMETELVNRYGAMAKRKMQKVLSNVVVDTESYLVNERIMEYVL